MKKHLSLLIVLAMLLGTVLMLAGCPGEEPPPGPGPGPGGDGQFIDSLGDFNFDGNDFTISCFSLYDYEIYGAEDSNETLDTLIFRRNSAIENRFNVNIDPLISVATGTDDFTTHRDEVQSALNAGEDTFDVVGMYAFLSGSLILGNGGNYLDWRSEVPYAKESIIAGKEWWPKDANLDCTIEGRQFIAVSDMSITAMEMCYSVIFHKELAESYHVAEDINQKYDTLYDVVDDGQWTLDNMYEIVKDFRYPGTAGDTNVWDEQDIYGLTGTAINDGDAWAFALGFNYLENDGVATPALWAWSSKIVTAIENLRDLYAAEGSYDPTDDIDRTLFFAQGHTLFSLQPLTTLKSDVIHNMEEEYGVLPYPKYDTNQTKYLTGSQDRYTTFSVPYTNYDPDNLEMTGVMMEALSAESCNSVKDAYYRAIVTHKNTCDEESVRMIDIIMEGRVYDITTYHYNELKLGSGTDAGDHSNSFGLFFRNLILTSDDIAGYWDSNRVSLESQLNNLMQDYSSIMVFQ